MEGLLNFMSANQNTRILIPRRRIRWAPCSDASGRHSGSFSGCRNHTLINRDNFFLFTPMLHEVAASDLDLSNIVSPVRQLLKRVHFFAGEVESIDLERKLVRVSHGFDRHYHDLAFDHIVIGVGSITNFFDIPGLAERALTMKSLGDAIHLRNRLIALLAWKRRTRNVVLTFEGPLLTFVVAGGGFAGVETVAAINDFVRHAVRYYANLREDMLCV